MDKKAKKKMCIRDSCQIVRRDQIERMKELKLRVNLQSIFLDYDTHIVHERVGDELASTSYPAKTLLNARIPFSNGSDAPVEEPNVMRGMECAVTRRSIGSTDAPYRPEEALTVREAIDSFTKSGAVASFEEGKKGEIANGQLADFVVLSEDPFKADANTLHLSLIHIFLVLFVTEMLCHGEAGEGDTHTHARGLVHLAEDERRFIADTAFTHFTPEVVTLTAALADAGKHGVTAVLHGDVVDELLDKDGLADACAAEQTDFAALRVRLQKIDDLDAGLEDLDGRVLLVLSLIHIL